MCVSLHPCTLRFGVMQIQILHNVSIENYAQEWVATIEKLSADLDD